MSNSVQPRRRQPTRLPRPWDSPGKNTGVGCHFLLQCMKVKSESEVAQSCPTSRPHGLQPTRLLRPWDFPAKSTGVGCHCLLLCFIKPSILHDVLCIYGEGNKQPTPVLLSGKCHGRRSLLGCSPWGREVGHDRTTSLSLFTFMH